MTTDRERVAGTPAQERAVSLTPEQRAAIDDYEGWIQGVIERRRPRDPASRTPWHQSAQLISGVVAVVSVLATGGMGYYTSMQLAERDRDWSKREELLRAERDLLLEVNALLANTAKAIDARLRIAQGKYDALPDSIINAEIRATNQADETWRRDSEAIGMRLGLAFPGLEAITSGWDSTRAAEKRYGQCVEDAYRRANTERRSAHAEACTVERALAEDRAEELRATFVNQFGLDRALDTPALVARQFGDGGQ